MTVVGNRTRVKVVKNKLAAPFREVEFDILYGQGVSRSGEIIDMAADANIVQKSGAWFSLDGERIGQGRDNARTYLEQHPALLDKLEQKVLAASGIDRGGAGAPPAPASPGPEEPNREKVKPNRHVRRRRTVPQTAAPAATRSAELSRISGSSGSRVCSRAARSPPVFLGISPEGAVDIVGPGRGASSQLCPSKTAIDDRKGMGDGHLGGPEETRAGRSLNLGIIREITIS